MQFTFIGAVSSHLLTKVGWHGLDFTSPFADLAILLNLNWLVILLYIDAFVSPFGTGVSFVTSSSRTLASMADNLHMPQFIKNTNNKWGVPRLAMIVNLIISTILVSVFRTWSVLASVISTSTLIAYMTGPITLISLRKHRPNFKRPVKIKFANLIAPLTFVITSLATYWAMWPTTVEVIGVILLGLPFYLFYENRLGWKNLKKGLKGSAWMICYLIFLSVISYIGSKPFGGINLIPYPLDFIVIIISALLFYYWGVNSYQETYNINNAKKINDQA